MTARSPLFLTDASGTNQIAEGDSTYMTSLHEFAGYAFAQNPNPYIEINGSNGAAIPGQPFVDTYWIAGAYSTRVDRFATEAETANISMSTDNYSRIREVTDTVAAPSGDANSHEYPLYLYNDGDGDDDIDTQLRSMTLTDFYDTFVSPVLTQFGGGGTTKDKGGTFFMTTSASPTNATLVSATPAAINSVADLTAYSAGGIAETLKQTTDTNYYIAKVDYSAANYPEVYDQLPIYWDFTNGQIKAHTPASWATLMNKFLRYYLSSNHSAGTYRLSYNVNGSNGVLNGTQFIDERRTPDGSAGAGGNYQQRYVNTNDYRTQEFPTGTTSVVSTKSFKIYQGPLDVISLEGTAGSPHTNVRQTTSDGSVRVGFTFQASRVVSEWDTDASPVASGTGHENWCNQIPQNDYWFRFTQISSPSGGSYTGDALNTWHADTATNSCLWTDNRTASGYADESAVWKVEIASDSGGSNIVATGYYQYDYSGTA